MPPESAKLLTDMRTCARRITEYARDADLQQYLSSQELRDAVHWNFAVIGEALSQLSKLDPATVQQISEWRRIIAFRNQLIHGYGVINHGITWDVIEHKLPILCRELDALLQSP